jgi:hypothetical protein
VGQPIDLILGGSQFCLRPAWRDAAGLPLARNPYVKRGTHPRGSGTDLAPEGQANASPTNASPPDIATLREDFERGYPSLSAGLVNFQGLAPQGFFSHQPHRKPDAPWGESPKLLSELLSNRLPMAATPPRRVEMNSKIGGPGWDRTNDQPIMSRPL